MMEEPDVPTHTHTREIKKGLVRHTSRVSAPLYTTTIIIKSENKSPYRAAKGGGEESVCSRNQRNFNGVFDTFSMSSHSENKFKTTIVKAFIFSSNYCSEKLSLLRCLFLPSHSIIKFCKQTQFQFLVRLLFLSDS